MSKDPSQPGGDWTWARLRESYPCPLPACGLVITPEQNVIILDVRTGADERRQLPFHPLCAAFVAARRVMRSGGAS